MIVVSLSLAAFALAGLRLFGGQLAQTAGLLMLAGLVGGAAIGDVNGLVVATPGAILWFGGPLALPVAVRRIQGPSRAAPSLAIRAD
jgi:hypothetical protein